MRLQPGRATETAILILAAPFGFSVVIQTSAVAYALLKYAGAVFIALALNLAFSDTPLPARS